MLQKQYSCTWKFRCVLLPPGFLLELFVSVSLILFVLHWLGLVAVSYTHLTLPTSDLV